MNRSTIFALLAFVVLLVVVLVTRTVPRGSEEPQLDVAGWKKAEPAAAATADATPAAPA